MGPCAFVIWAHSLILLGSFWSVCWNLVKMTVTNRCHSVLFIHSIILKHVKIDKNSLHFIWARKTYVEFQTKTITHLQPNARCTSAPRIKCTGAPGAASHAFQLYMFICRYTYSIPIYYWSRPIVYQTMSYCCTYFVCIDLGQGLGGGGGAGIPLETEILS